MEATSANMDIIQILDPSASPDGLAAMDECRDATLLAMVLGLHRLSPSLRSKILKHAVWQLRGEAEEIGKMIDMVYVEDEFDQGKEDMRAIVRATVVAHHHAYHGVPHKEQHLAFLRKKAEVCPEFMVDCKEAETKREQPIAKGPPQPAEPSRKRKKRVI